MFILNGSKEPVDPIEIPVLKKQNSENIKPVLSILISSQKDLHFCSETQATIYFQLPNSFKNYFAELIALFRENKKIIPWFPSVLIGADYRAAVEFLEQVQPKQIVSNNTGIAYEAGKKGIPWIAGPYLNIVNSFSLLCLKETFNCSGAFISNELSKTQIKSIKRPENFDLFYSIYHPITLMTSRQCLLHQVTGCTKDKIDDACIPQCEKFATITNLKKETFFIEKSKGNYHCIYNETNFLNTEIVTDAQNLISCFLVDLRDIKTETQIEADKSSIIKHFENILIGNLESKKELKQMIHPTTNTQYKKGI